MNSILTIFSVSYSDNGTYNCTAVNAAHGKEAPLDTDTRTFSITVLSESNSQHWEPFYCVYKKFIIRNVNICFFFHL